MQKLFNKILVPVDFTAGSRRLLEKAVDTAVHYNCKIHLLHVVPYKVGSLFTTGAKNTLEADDTIDNRKELELQMKKLCSFIPFLRKNTDEPIFSIIKGSWDEVIIEFIKEQHFDLLFTGQNSILQPGGLIHLNADKIAQKTNIPVITLPFNRRITKLYSIVIPVTDFIPLRKLIYGIYLAHGYNGKIKLLGIENKKTKNKVGYYLKKAFYLIHDNCNVPVEIDMILCNNVAEGVNEFAKINAADLIIVNPGTQTKMPGFFSRLMGNILQKYSSPPVLTITTA